MKKVCAVMSMHTGDVVSVFMHTVDGVDAFSLCMRGVDRIVLTFQGSTVCLVSNQASNPSTWLLLSRRKFTTTTLIPFALSRRH